MSNLKERRSQYHHYPHPYHQKETTMQHSEFLTADPSEIIYAVTMQDILKAIESRLGEGVSTLTEDDIRLASDEVKAVIDTELDIRDYIDMGLDIWNITRNL